MRHWPRLLPFIAALLALFNVGCASHHGAAISSMTTGDKAATDYADAYKALMLSYRKQIGELMARPLPPKSLPKEKKREALARQVDDVADAYEGFAGRLDALHPPPLFQETHRSTRSFFMVSSDDTHRWAEAIRHGDRAARVRAAHQLDTDSLASLTQMQHALKRSGGTAQAQQMQSEIDQVRQEISK